jgi:V8-like Glu-specific endopeptidase
MDWNQNLTNLRDWLADRYYTVEQSRRVAVEAGLKPRYIQFDDQAVVNWFNILTYAQHQDAVGRVIDVVLVEHPTEKTYLLGAKAGVLTGVGGPDIKTDVAWQGPEDGGELEKIIGMRSALLPVHFLEVGAAKARSVVRVQLPEGSGSGFLTAGDLLITNHHVIATKEQAASAVIQCNYQVTPALLSAPVKEFKLAPDKGFATSESDDWTAVKVQGNPNTKWGALPLARATPRKDDWINIIQHPDGGPKQIALYDNLIVFVDDKIVQYLTDTLPGSSGSPCFDSEWQVIALHHSGGWLREPGTKQRYYRNEGIHINKVIDGLVDAGLLKE